MQNLNIHFLSDLFLDDTNGLDSLSIPSDSNLVIFSGNVSGDRRLPEYLESISNPSRDVILVPGPLEYEGKDLLKTKDSLFSFAEKCSHFHFLDDAFVEIRDTLFVGSTLWADGLLGCSNLFQTSLRSMCNARLDFYRTISMGGIPLGIDGACELGKQSKSFIQEALMLNFQEKKVVITHFAPAYSLVNDGANNEPLNCALYSETVSADLVTMSDLWVHGAVGRSVFKDIGETLVAANPVFSSIKEGKTRSRNSEFSNLVSVVI